MRKHGTGLGDIKRKVGTNIYLLWVYKGIEKYDNNLKGKENWAYSMIDRPSTWKDKNGDSEEGKSKGEFVRDYIMRRFGTRQYSED